MVSGVLPGVVNEANDGLRRIRAPTTIRSDSIRLNRQMLRYPPERETN
jgi:hypothetical protein